MRIPLRFRAETKYAEASEKKANVNPPMMAAVGNGDGTTFRVAGRDNFYWIRLINDANRLTQCFSPAVALQYDDYIYVAKASDRKLTYYEFVSFIQAVGGETSPILTARGIIIPDNEAQAFYVEDDDSVGAGSPEYVRIVSTDGAQAVEFNFNNDDVDFIVNANALANAFVLDGATGAITLAGPSMTVPDDWWVGLGAGAGRLVFDSTPAPDQMVMTSADLNMNGNDIIIPDNTAVAFQILDDGAAAPANIDYMQIVTTNAGPAQAVIFNNGEADVDFRVAASGVTNAILVDGATGDVSMSQDLTVAGHIAAGAAGAVSANEVIDVAETFTAVAGDYAGVRTVVTFAPGANFATSVSGNAFATIINTNFARTAGAIYGVQGYIIVQDLATATNLSLFGGNFWCDVEDASAADATGARAWTPFVDTGACTTGRGLWIRQGTVGAGGITTLYGLDIEAITAGGTNYAIRSAGGRSYHAGTLAVGGTDSTAAQLYVDQSSTTAAIPVAYFDQADVSEEMFEFNTTIGVGNAIEAVGAKTLTTTHFIKVTLPGGLTRYFPVGTIA